MERKIETYRQAKEALRREECGEGDSERRSLVGQLLNDAREMDDEDDNSGEGLENSGQRSYDVDVDSEAKRQDADWRMRERYREGDSFSDVTDSEISVARSADYLFIDNRP